MRAGADPPPVAAPPVGKVVAALIRLAAREVRDLIPLEARGSRAVGDELVGIGHEVRIGLVEFAAAQLAGHFGVALDDKRVGAHVIRLHLGYRLDGGLDVRERLPRRPINHVEAHLKASLPGPRDGSRDGFGVVGAVKDREHTRHSRLHAEAHAGESCLGEAHERIARDGVGVRLGCHFGVRGERDKRVEVGEHARLFLGGQEGGGAAPEEHGVNAVVREARRLIFCECELHFAHRVIRIFSLRASPAKLFCGVRIEVAVAAAHRAKRHVNVDREPSASGVNFRGHR